MRTTSRTTVSLTLTPQQIDLLAAHLASAHVTPDLFASDEIKELYNICVAVRTAQAYLKGTV